MKDSDDKYATLLASVQKACEGTGCLNAYELRENLNKTADLACKWKAAHDDLVIRNRELRDRPDLADRARSIKNLRAKMEKAQAELTQLQHVHAATEAELEQARKDRDTLAAAVKDLAIGLASELTCDDHWTKYVPDIARQALERAST